MAIASPPPSPPHSSAGGTLLVTTSDNTTPPGSNRDALATTALLPRRATPPLEQIRAALEDAKGQVSDLQKQVRLLNDKASAAVDRWADYEDELANLRAELAAAKEAARPDDGRRPSTATGHQPASLLTPTPTNPNSASPSNATATATAAAWSSSLLPSPQQNTVTPRTSTSSFFPAGAASRLSALLTPRKLTPPSNKSNSSSSKQHRPTLSTGPPSHASSLSVSFAAAAGNGQQEQQHQHQPSGGALSPTVPLSPLSLTPSTDELMDALSREQSLRLAAESRLSETSREVEELSVSLFEQANKMVATERRARARLEERVSDLERRDAERRPRLERLESAIARIERVRAILGEDGSNMKKHNSNGGSGGDGAEEEEAQMATKKAPGSEMDSMGSEKKAGGRSR